MSAEGLRVAFRDDVLVLTLASPPANTLTAGLRGQLMQALRDRDPAIRGVVLTAEAAAFSNGFALDSDETRPTLAELCQMVADCPVPVVAVLQGVVSGPGAELALAARARLASMTLRLAFPEVLLGLCPEAGTTLRLPRLIGAKAALKMLLSGRPVPAAEALKLGLVDGITETAPLAAAIRLAVALASGELLLRPAPDPVAWQADVAVARRDPAVRLPAARRIVDCVEAALLLPAENALSFEAVTRRDLAETPEAAGLRAAARAERQALNMPTVLARLRPLTVDRIGLCGAAPDLARLAIAALTRDLAVHWVFPQAFGREAGLAAVRAGLAQSPRGDVMGGTGVPPDRLTTGDDPGSFASLPLVICDSLPESGDLPDGPLGAARLFLGGAERGMGLGLSASGRIAELSLPARSLPLAKATAIAGLRRIGLSLVLAGSRPLIGERLADAGKTALAWMVARGVPRRLIASALADFGARPPDALTGEAPPVMRAMPQAEVVQRWLAALANEGARLLDEGIALHASDIDHLLVGGFGFPRWQGGPMHLADRRGLMVLRHDLRLWADEGPLWTPSPLIDRLIGEGRGFLGA